MLIPFLEHCPENLRSNLYVCFFPIAHLVEEIRISLKPWLGHHLRNHDNRIAIRNYVNTFPGTLSEKSPQQSVWMFFFHSHLVEENFASLKRIHDNRITIRKYANTSLGPNVPQGKITSSAFHTHYARTSILLVKKSVKMHSVYLSVWIRFSSTDFLEIAEEIVH